MRTRTIAALVVVSVLALGCDRILGRKNDVVDPDNSGAGGNATATAGAKSSPTDKVGAAAVEGCVLPANGQVAADFTVKKGCTVSVASHVRVTNDATLTIEEGATLQVDASRYIAVAKGKLVAKGTAEAPVKFTSAATTKAPGDWVGVVFEDDTSAGTELDFVRIEYAGAAKAGGRGAITMRAQRSGGRITITNTTIEESEQVAVWSDSEKAKFQKFEKNTMRKNKGSLSVPAEVLGSVGAGNAFTDPLTTFGSVDETTTWPAVDAPIIVERNIMIGGDGGAPTLTIAPKTVLKFGGGRYIDVGVRGGGTLVAKDVTFTSANATPQPGDWAGVFLEARATNVDLTGATIEYAGKGAGAHGGVTVRGKATELGGLKASGITFRNNVGAGVSTSDGVCTPFENAKSEGAPACGKN